VNREDDGFTLVELLMVVAIMGVVIPAFAFVMIVYFRSAFAASVRTDRANDANTASAYLQPDFASSKTATVGGACQNTLTMTWTQDNPLPNGDDGTPDDYSVVYVVQPTAVDGPYKLLRTLTVNHSSAGSQTVLHGLASSCDVTFTRSAGHLTVAVSQADPSGTAEVSTLRMSGEIGSRS
jgi:prepilin-type N-terminal cleavage/methylation domain-containing protein